MIVAFNDKFAKSNLPPNSSKINFNHANVFCSLFALNNRLLCNHVHCILRAAGERHARTVIDSNFSQLTLLTPDFLPQFHAPSLITNWLIPSGLHNNYLWVCDHTLNLFINGCYWQAKKKVGTWKLDTLAPPPPQFVCFLPKDWHLENLGEGWGSGVGRLYAYIKVNLDCILHCNLNFALVWKSFKCLVQ